MMEVHAQGAAALRSREPTSSVHSMKLRRVKSSFEVIQRESVAQPFPPTQLNPADLDRPKRQARKPSPGLAARLRALGLGTSYNGRKQPTHAVDSIGRIPEDQIRKLDLLARPNSTESVQRRDRAWSNTTLKLPPQIIGDSSSGFKVSRLDAASTAQDRIIDVEDSGFWEPQSATSSTADATEESDMVNQDDYFGMEGQKYRLPEHMNGNGTKTTPDTREAHIKRADEPPPPISKDPPPSEVPPPNDANDYNLASPPPFNPFGLQRTGSIYTLSRISFASQLAQLTSLQLPDAESLSSKVAAIPTSQAATKALMSAAEQIRSWISKASDVLGGLDSEDDVEWAAAGGREGLEDVDNAIVRFEQLVKIFVNAIEQLQTRRDISSVPSKELTKVVKQVETILDSWEKVRAILTGVKSQVEIAMEWEELWNVVLGDIGNEMDTLSRLVFEMEERRHQSLIEETTGVDIGDLETIVEETPTTKTRLQTSSRFNVGSGFPMNPNAANAPGTAQDDSSLLALFARMQPLRASLDFLPMRLSTFHARAEKTFPTACSELESRRSGLEDSWKALERDAESLRRELGEDRWVLVFRGAGRQALKMYESVERSISKLKENIDSEGHFGNFSTLGKKVESYEAKKQHYGPAIERVLAIIDKGVHDRLTVNGEIVRLHSDMQKKWQAMKLHMVELDNLLEEAQADSRNQHLRDSLSSLVSNDRSTVASVNGTPGSSPASSVIVSGLEAATPVRNGKTRYSTSNLPRLNISKTGTSPASNSAAISLPRRAAIPRSAGLDNNPSHSPATRTGSMTPLPNRLPRPTNSSDSRPRWTTNFKPNQDPVGMTFNALQLSTPSPHTREKQDLGQLTSSTASHKESKIPLRNSLAPNTPFPDRSPSRARTGSRIGHRENGASPDPHVRQLSSSSNRTLRSQTSTPSLSASRRISLQPSHLRSRSPQPRSAAPTRPASSLAGNRRVSLLPQARARGRQGSSVTGRESPQAIAGAASAMRRGTSQASMDSQGREKPRWR